jgi:AmiR/NasT family two-component response regulator
VCSVPIVFITAYTDRDTVKRIHEQVPGAPVIAKPLYREYLAKAVAIAGAPCRQRQETTEKALARVPQRGWMPQKTTGFRFWDASPS